jgi:ketosteroid isomerase-like protein
MKTLLALVALAVSAATLADTIKADTPPSDASTFMALETAWATALQKNDKPALAKILADEYQFIDPSGQTSSKADDLHASADSFVLETFRISDFKVHVYGDVATVTGLNTLTAKASGQDASGDYRFTDVFVKRAGRWQCVVSHITRVVATS